MATRLSGLENKSATGNVRPYSVFIKSVKIILPLTALGIIGLLVIWPQIAGIETAPLTKEDITALEEAERENRLLKPVFNTLDNKGKPFSISAKEATQLRTNSDQVLLTQPTADMHDDGNTLHLEAEAGEYNQTDKILILKDGVTIKDAEDNVLTTDMLTTSISEGKAVSNSPAVLTTSQGTIEGKSVIIDQQNQTTTFQGPAKAVINQ